MGIEEKDGQFDSRFDGKEMKLYEIVDDTELHVGTIDISKASVTYAREGYEEIVTGRIAPLASIRASLGIK